MNTTVLVRPRPEVRGKILVRPRTWRSLLRLPHSTAVCRRTLSTNFNSCRHRPWQRRSHSIWSRHLTFTVILHFEPRVLSGPSFNFCLTACFLSFPFLYGSIITKEIQKSELRIAKQNTTKSHIPWLLIVILVAVLVPLMAVGGKEEGRRKEENKITETIRQRQSMPSHHNISTVVGNLYT